VIEIVFNPTVETYIDNLPLLLREAVEDTLEYFREHGRSAQLPDVAKLVQLDETWETRNQETIGDRRYTIRILLLRLQHETLAYATVIGDKDRWYPARGDWYDVYGTISNQVYDQMKGTND